MTEQQLNEWRKLIASRGKYGIGFLMAAVVIWFIITMIFTTSFDMKMKNLLLLCSTGLMFPLSIFFTKRIRAEWRFKDEPLASLGAVLNVAQLAYFPLVFWAFIESPAHLVVIFAIIIGAHFLPYGWFYHTKIYYVFSIMISVSILILSWLVPAAFIWLIPFVMVIFLSLLILFLSMNGKDNERSTK